jgi:drug/metabolite transporter (DMT)-like permease
VNKNLVNWILFVSLSFIWGSSFILMKIGLDNELSPYQVASIRIIASGLVLIPTCIRVLKTIPISMLPFVFLSGTLGSLIPAYLFCIAEQGIDSSLAGMLNSLTPIFVIITGALFFKNITPLNKIIGIAVAFSGSVLLLLSKGHIGEGQQQYYVLYVVFATFLYGFNVNMVAKRLIQIPSLHIAAVGLSLNAILALIVLIYTGFFHLDFHSDKILMATGAATLLGVIGTAVATILFYVLVKRSSGIFASMVTYGIPFVAIGWGVVYKENFGWTQVVCLLIILFGVYWANRKPAISILKQA